MLVHPGDLIPVQEDAIQIPWTRRKSQILHYLHKGSVTFQTYVYDTNVGDISCLSTYFNPERWTVDDLNDKFAQRPESESTFVKAVAEGGNNSSTTIDGNNNNQAKDYGASSSVLPRLLLCPEEISLSEKEKQTMQWVILQSTVKAALKAEQTSTEDKVVEERAVEGSSSKSLLLRLPSPSSSDDVFLPWESSSHSHLLKPPSADVWRHSLSESAMNSPFLWDGSFFESSSSTTNCSWTQKSRRSSTLLSASNSDKHQEPLNAQESCLRNKEDFLLGESLLQNITNDFLRNETLV